MGVVVGHLERNDKRIVAGRMDAGLERLGSTPSCDLSVAGDPCAGSRTDMARNRGGIVYRCGVQRAGTGRGRPGLQPDDRRPIWMWRCHGDLVSGAISGFFQKSVRSDVGIIGGICRVVVPDSGQKEIHAAVDPVYSLPDRRVCDPAGNWACGGVRRMQSQPCGFRRHRPRSKKDRRRYLQASFTIEAALLIPLVLAVLFLLMQIVLYLHDTVSAEAWLYQETWKIRWNEEQDSLVYKEADPPSMAVFRYQNKETETQWHTVRQQATFDVALLPKFVTVIFNGQPGTVTKTAREKEISSWQFIRIVGAIREEWEEWKR